MADLILRDTDANELSRLIAAEVAEQVGAMLASKMDPARLVDRIEMARLASIGTATLDGLVSAGKVPSVSVGRRRLFEPARVIAAMAGNNGRE